MKEFDIEELAKYNGKDGQPAYVVVDDKVYDVSDSKLWPKGAHMKRHYAGSNMTTDIQAAPHEADVLEKFPQVGILKKVKIDEDIPEVLAKLLAWKPFLRPHLA